jgi:FixJ family two-component response regulator
MTKPRVIVVDDASDIREGLQDLLSDEYEVKTFESAELFLEALNDFEFEDGLPTCVLLDFQMEGMNGVELQTTLKQMNVEFPIIFMSGNALQADIVDAWRGGAIDFMLKPFTAAQISDVLSKLFQRAEAAKAAQAPALEVMPVVELPITRREAQVLQLLGKGHQQHEVADMLGLSLRTIKTYRTFLKNKLDLNTLMELARYYDKYRLSIEKMAQLDQ